MNVQHTRSELARPHAHRSEHPRRVGQWELLALLGQGSWSRVYQARPATAAAHTAADYAVKVACTAPALSSLANQLIAREAEVVRQVTHPHLVAVLASQLDRVPRYLVMPLLRGTTIGRLLRAGGRLSPAQALWIARQTAEALAVLHAAGWIHADVKPDNIMLSAEGHATLLDLGFALQAGSTECRRGNELRGTIAYTAPEMISSVEPRDQQSDIYSLGATLYEMLTGAPAFAAADACQLAAAHLHRPPPNPRLRVPGLHPRVSKLLQQMLAKQPLRRPSAAALVEQLVDLEILVFDDRTT